MRKAIEDNLKHKRFPCEDARIMTLGEILFILLEQGWAGDIVLGERNVERAAKWFIQARRHQTGDNLLPPADLRRIDLRAANIRWINLQRALLGCANLKGVDLRNADLVDADLTGALFTGANLGEGETQTILITGARADALSKSRRQRPDAPPYADAVFASINELLWVMREENWTGELQTRGRARADLREADLSTFDLDGMDLTGARLTDTKLISQEREQELRTALLTSTSTSKSTSSAMPCNDVQIATRNELLWVMREHGWSGDPDPGTLKRANLRGAELSGAHLRRADLEGADLAGAKLEKADLHSANLHRANLRGVGAARATLRSTDMSHAKADRARLDVTDVQDADLSNASLRGAKIIEADLRGANLSVAHLHRADFRGADFSCADLRGALVDAATSFIDIHIDTGTLLGDIVWYGLPLTQIDWRQAPRLGDERDLDPRRSRGTGKSRATVYRDVTRAYRNLWTALRRQGIYTAASRYRLREKRLERKNYWERKRYGRWANSLRADLISGYGEIPSRSLLTFFIIIPLYALIYFYLSNVTFSWLPGSGQDKLSLVQSIMLSLTLFQGHTQSLAAVLAAVGLTETLIGGYVLLAFTVLRTRQILGQSV